MGIDRTTDRSETPSEPTSFEQQEVFPENNELAIESHEVESSADGLPPRSILKAKSSVSLKSDVRGQLRQKPASNQMIVAGLDIGSSKVSVTIALLKASQASESEVSVEVIGYGLAPSEGIRQGVVVNVEATIEAIKKARDEAELMSGYRISDVILAVGGNHVKSFDSRGMVAIRNHEVKADDIERVIEAAKAVAVPADRQVLHVLPREYKIDEQSGITDPVGMSGVRLEANVHIITAGQTALHNTIKCAEKAGLHVRSLVLQQLASSLAVLSDDEKKLGVSVVDIGGGTCDIITYVAGAVAHTASVPVGGAHFTQDIAMGLRTPQVAAELIKVNSGCAIAQLVDENETVEVEGVGGRKPRAILRRDLCEIIEPRAEETVLLIWQEIRRSGLADQIGSGIVITGGASMLDGLTEMGEFVCEVPVRRGYPDRVGGLRDVIRNTESATGVGLIVYAAENLTANERHRLSQPARDTDHVSMVETVDAFTQKIKDFFNGTLS